MSYVGASNDLPDWAADIPDDRRTDWLKWWVELSGRRPTEEEKETLPHISNEDIASWTGKLLVEDPKPSEAEGRIFRKNDVLFNKLRPYLAKGLCCAKAVTPGLPLSPDALIPQAL